MKHRSITIVLSIVSIATMLVVGTPSNHTVSAQSVLRPIDMMMVIDNSCSMFSSADANCADQQNDPDKLRIVGSNLFIARLGFAETNEDKYQLGVVNLGDDASTAIVRRLQPLKGARDEVSNSIANPKPALATQLVPALRLAYNELKTSPNRRADHVPAIVLITDGEPNPIEGQSQADIEQLINENPGVQLFTLLLINDATASPEFQQYTQFWQNLRTTHSNVWAYRVNRPAEIEQTYNSIVAQLQNTIPVSGTSLTPSQSLDVFVDKYVRKLIITVNTNGKESNVRVRDPRAAEIQPTDSGVSIFRGSANPFEIISIASPRLDDSLKNDTWTITADQPVTVFLDRQGAYRVDFRSPAVSRTELTNVYLANDRQSPSNDLVVQFRLATIDGAIAITERQDIQGVVRLPDGNEVPWNIPTGLAPDGDGLYSVPFDILGTYPAAREQPGRFTFVVNAGSADRAGSTGAARTPIASAQLLVDVGPGPFFKAIGADPVACKANQPTPLDVSLGDFDSVEASSATLRVFLGGADTQLKSRGGGVFSGDIASLCAPLIEKLTCGTSSEGTLKLRFSGQLTSGIAVPSFERNVPVTLAAPACAPTPSPLPPPPPPTAVPDSDHDGLNDVLDRCPEVWGIGWFSGCRPIWFVVAFALAIIALLGWIILVLVPWAMVRFVAPPPKGYVLISTPGKAPILKSLYGTGMQLRKSRIVIGSDRRRAQIYVAGLKPVEYVAVRDGTTAKLLDQNNTVRATIDATPKPIPLSLQGATMLVCLDQSRLRP